MYFKNTRGHGKSWRRHDVVDHLGIGQAHALMGVDALDGAAGMLRHAHDAPHAATRPRD